MESMLTFIRSLAELSLTGSTYISKIDCGDRNHIYAGVTKNGDTLTAQVVSAIISVWAVEFTPTTKEG